MAARTMSGYWPHMRPARERSGLLPNGIDLRQQSSSQVNIDGHGPSMSYNRTMTSKLHQKHKESLQDFIPVEALFFI